LTVTIVTVADRSYRRYLIVLLRSLVRAHPQRNVDVAVLTRCAHRRCLSELWPRGTSNVQVDIIDVDHLLPQSIELNYLRLVLAEALPNARGRLLYLDADTLVRVDLAALLATDIGEKTVGAAPDYLGYCRSGVSNWHEMGLGPDDLYFNSGVLLIDVDRWRSKDIGRRALEICLANRSHLLALGQHPQHDQYGLNVVLHDDWHVLSSRWNWGAELISGPGRIIHYLGNGKPHSDKCTSEHARWFHDLSVGPGGGKCT
jgi:lipopolysaccharide biosynthesis glycosyltransferase